MRNPIHNSWHAKRNKAIDRFIIAWNKYDGKDAEDVNTALDAIAVADIASKIEWDRNAAQNWNDAEQRAMERLANLWETMDGAEDPDMEEKLDHALDSLALAHTASAFEGLSGPLKW